MKPGKARRIVARQVIADMLEREIAEQWENYPGIGEHDWDRIDQLVMAAGKKMLPKKYLAAYAVLEERALAAERGGKAG